VVLVLVPVAPPLGAVLVSVLVAAPPGAVLVSVVVAAPPGAVLVSVLVAAPLGAVLVSVLVAAPPGAVAVAVLVAPPSGDVPPSLPPPQAVNEAASAKLAAARAIVWNFTINLIRLLRELLPVDFYRLDVLAARQVSNYYYQPDAAQ
jgi:hypothetical protein